jgi:protein-tyrosine phosphatase
MGNICRSPMAEAVFRHQVAAAGLAGQFEIESAGTGGWHAGESAHPGTLKVLRAHGVEHYGRARQIEFDDLREFTYVLTMDASNLNHVRRMAQQGGDAEVGLFLDYATRRGVIDVSEVPDPYYSGNFDYVYQLVEKGSAALLDHIRSEHNI